MRMSLKFATALAFCAGGAMAGQVSVTPPTGIVISAPTMSPVTPPAVPAPQTPTPTPAPPVPQTSAQTTPAPQVALPQTATPPVPQPSLGQTGGFGGGTPPAAVVQGFNVGSLSQVQMQQAIQLIDGLLSSPQSGLTPELRATLQSQRDTMSASLQGQ